MVRNDAIILYILIMYSFIETQKEQEYNIDLKKNTINGFGISDVA